MRSLGTAGRRTGPSTGAVGSGSTGVAAPGPAGGAAAAGGTRVMARGLSVPGHGGDRADRRRRGGWDNMRPRGVRPVTRIPVLLLTFLFALIASPLLLAADPAGAHAPASSGEMLSAAGLVSL